MEAIFLIVILAGIAVGFWYLAHAVKSKNAGGDEKPAMLLIQNQINELSRTIDAKLSQAGQAAQFQFGESTKIIKEVTERLVKLDEANKQVIGFAEQLSSLQDILQNPKQRGVLGEYYLETVLENVLPPGTWQAQYEFKDGTKVDAVIFVKDKIIPVDSKFSLENYNRILESKDSAERERLEGLFKNDLKNRIEETAKYIKPGEGTLEFAFMFIPSEAIYYDLLVNKVGTVKANTRDLIEYAANEKKVIIVSPTSFLAYLQTVLQGLKALQIEESAKEIRKRVEGLGRHLITYETYMKKLGGHLGTTVSTYNRASKELGKIDKDVLKISGFAANVGPEMIETPEAEDNQ